MYTARKLLLTAGVALLANAGAQANVVYNWQSTSSGKFAQATNGQLVLSDQAYSDGSLNIDYSTPFDNVEFGDTGAIVDSPIRSASLSFDAKDGGSGSPFGVDVAPPEAGFGSLGQSITADLTLNENGTVSGNMDIFGLDTNFDSQGDRDSWTITDVNSDAFTGSGHCTGNFDTPCSGGTGFWQLDASSVPADVPGPNPWSLFGLAALGLIWARTRRANG